MSAARGLSAHPLHQLPQGCSLRGRHRVPGVPQIVEVEFGKADRSPGPVPELAEVRPAQPTSLRPDEDQAPSDRDRRSAPGGHAARHDVLGERHRPGTCMRLRVPASISRPSSSSAVDLSTRTSHRSRSTWFRRRPASSPNAGSRTSPEAAAPGTGSGTLSSSSTRSTIGITGRSAGVSCPAPLIRHGLRRIRPSSTAVAMIPCNSRYALATRQARTAWLCRRPGVEAFLSPPPISRLADSGYLHVAESRPQVILEQATVQLDRARLEHVSLIQVSA